MVTFNVCTQAKFNSITAKDPDALYFTSDTHKIYKGSDLYTGNIKMVPTFPSVGDEGTLYINSTNLEAKIYSGGAWVQTAKPYTSTVSTENGDYLPTSAAVISYVQNMLDEIEASLGNSYVSGISYSNTDGEPQLSVSKGGTSTPVSLTGLITGAELDTSTMILTLHVSGGEDITINLPKDNFIVSGSYNEETKEIELTMKDGSVIKIPAGDLVDIYTGGATATVAVSVSSGNVITANVKLSATAGNALTAEADGLYVAPTDVSGKMDKLSSTTASGMVVVTSSGGTITATSVKIGGATLSENPTANILATEAAVSAIQAALENRMSDLEEDLSNKLSVDNITQTLSAATVETNKVPSNKAVVGALSWNTIT